MKTTNTSNLAEKLAGTGCALSAVYLLPAAGVQAADVVGGTVSVDLGDGLVYWDVDGNGSDDFVLVGRSTYAYLDTYDLSASTSLGGRGMVQTTGQTNDVLQNLSTGFDVGPSLAAGYQWGASQQDLRTIVTSSTVGFDAALGGFVGGDNQYFGFRFVRAGQTHYGWAEINIRISAPPFGFTIEQWCWNDEPNEPVTVGECDPSSPIEPTAVPVNSLPFVGLTLLGLGGAGLRELRRRRKQTA